MRVGKDTRIHETAIFTRPELCHFGGHVAVDAFFYATTALEIGNYVHISAHTASIGGEAGRLIMKDFTFLSVGSKVVCVSDDFYGSGLINPMFPKELQSEHYGGDIVFEKHSGVGANVVVLPGVTLGEGAVVGANSVVTKPLEEWGVYIGNRRIADRPKEKILEYEQIIHDSTR